MAIEQHVNGKVNTFLLLSRDQLKNGCDQYIMSIVRAVGRHWKIQVQIRTKTSSTAMKTERNAFSLPARISLIFLKCSLLNDNISCSKQLMRSCPMFSRVQMQYRASAVDKIKIRPAMISFIENTTSSQMADQNDDFITKDSFESFSFFLKVPKWMTSCQNGGYSQENFKNSKVFFPGKSVVK